MCGRKNKLIGKAHIHAKYNSDNKIQNRNFNEPDSHNNHPEEKLLTAGNLLNNYILSFVADEYIFKKSGKEADAPVDLLFAKELHFTDDQDQQFVYGLEVILVGLKQVKKQLE